VALQAVEAAATQTRVRISFLGKLNKLLTVSRSKRLRSGTQGGGYQGGQQGGGGGGGGSDANTNLKRRLVRPR
jgi:hypothetical protein